MFAAAWLDLPARSDYCSIKQVCTASYLLIESDWLRWNACIRAVHEACGRAAKCLVFSRQHTPCNFSAHSSQVYFGTDIQPLLDCIGPYFCGSSACIPTEPRTIHFGRRNSQCPHFAIRQLILRIPSHPSASCIAVTPQDLHNCLLRPIIIVVMA
jgi:hypothetical protein